MNNSDKNRSRLLNEAQKMESAIRGACGTSSGISNAEFLCRSVSVLEPADPITAEEGDSLEKVCGLLQKHSIGCVLITNNHDELVGVFSERDFMTRVFQKVKDIENSSVRDFMTKEPVTVEPDTPIAFCLHLMSEGGFRHLPMVDRDGMPISIISVRDVVNYLVNRLVADIDGLVKA
jgi:CBS domain-containing protein